MQAWQAFRLDNNRDRHDTQQQRQWSSFRNLQSASGCGSSMEDALVATSCRGDLLIVTQNNALGYSHHAFQKLYPVCIPHKRLEHTSLCIVRFNHKADAVILAGRHFLGVVLPPPRDQNGALCPSDEWRLEIFLNDPSNSSSTQILDATFPQQFDNHICTIDASGVITFWDIYGGDTTSLITGVPHVQMLCFGSEQHSQCNRILACQLHVP